jgi:hypothetical protein
MGQISRHRRRIRMLRSSRRQWHKTAIISTALQIRNNFRLSRFKIRNPPGSSKPPARPFWSRPQPLAKKKTNSDLRRSYPHASITCRASNAANTTTPRATANLKRAPSYLWTRVPMARAGSHRSQRNSSTRGLVHLNSMTCLRAQQTICTATRPS